MAAYVYFDSPQFRKVPSLADGKRSVRVRFRFVNKPSVGVRHCPLDDSRGWVQ